MSAITAVLHWLMPPEREVNMRLVNIDLGALDAAHDKMKRMLADMPQRNTNARERLGENA